MTPCRRASLVLASALLLAAACRHAPGKQARGDDVRLLLLIAVDQFPAYLFQRYDSLYTGGLRRLLDEGRTYERAVHDHALTWTSAGHATLATGMVPARHGVVANRWLERIGGDWRSVPSVDDSAESIVGLPSKIGMSPRNLEATGIADWVLAADTAARAVAISGKRTASVLMAGQASSARVYYFEDDIGRFVTSTYYRDSEEEWVERFNRELLPELIADSVWECSVPAEARPLARRDDAPYENEGRHVSFPHRAVEEMDAPGDPAAYYDWWDHTPKLDEATVALARAAVLSLQLGRRGQVDYLAVGLSQLDRVGHYYGPLSLEQLDAVLRVDRLLGELLGFLDQAVGKDRYVLAFTSDHGVVPLPEYRRELGLNGKYVSPSEIREAFDTASQSAAALSNGGDRRAAVIRALGELDYVADVMTVEELAGPESADSFVALYQRSYYPGRVSSPLAREGLVLRLVEGVHMGPEPTTHGSPYLYDRRVPLIFMGPGIAGGSTDERARTVDVAPTLARLAGVPFPAGLDGRPLPE